jgi:hypothetical protein
MIAFIGLGAPEIIVLIVVGLLVIGGIFAVIYWWLGRGGDDTK